MSTTQQNNVALLLELPVMFPAIQDGTFDIKGGDLVYFDTSAHILKTLDTDAHGDYFAGMALNGSKYSPAPYGLDKYFPAVPVAQKAIVRMSATVGETYYHGQAVYLGADAQTIKNTAGGYTRILGYVSMPEDNTAAGHLAVAGDKIRVELAVDFPTTAFA